VRSACRRVLARLHRRGRDAGMSLTELLVVSLVSSILLTALGVMVSSSLRASQTASTHVSATAEGRLATDAVARRLRVAVRPSGAPSVFVEAGASRVTLYTSLSEPGVLAPAPSTVSYEVVGDCLTETITPPSGTVRSTCLARGQVELALSYYQVTPQPTEAEPSPSPAPNTPLALDADGMVPAAELDSIGAVQIDLGMRDPRSTSAHPVRMSTRVLLVNRFNEDLG
jgi:prepilin-type N-terminal cleavage/methylation domain-containing protein